MITDKEKKFLKSKKIVRSNIIRYKKDLVHKIDNLCKKRSVSFSEMVFIIINGECVCANCKINKPKFISNKSGYKKYCSRKCSNSHSDTIKSKKKSYLKKYGVDNPSKSKKIKNKISKSNSNQSIETKKKRRESMINNYGVSSNIFRKEIINKRINSLKSKKVISKRKKTFNEKYNANCPLDIKEVKEKFKITNKNKWGESHFSKSKKYKEKNLRNHINNLNESHKNELIINSLKERMYNIFCNNCNKEFNISVNAYNIRKNQKLEICTNCNPINYNRSLLENDIYNFISKNYDKKIIQGFRINNKEIDIYLPELKVGFEFNGVYWHSEYFKGKKYHYNKYLNFKEKDIKLIQIWEDDWINKKKIIKSIILNKISKSNKIWARKCSIKNVYSEVSKKFLNENHIQGWCISKIRLGLYYKEELVCLMTFGKERKNLGNNINPNKFELLRFCNKLNTSVVGGASKLLKKFKKDYNPESLISYSKNDYSDGGLYNKIGFNIDSETEPNYYWVVKGVRENRFNWRKDKLVKMGYNKDKTEIEIMHSLGYWRCFDSGNKKWIYEKRYN